MINTFFLVSLQSNDLIEGNDKVLNILTYNLHDASLLTPINSIKELNLDLLSVQEYIPESEAEIINVASTLGMEYFSEPSYNFSKYNLMIFSKWPILHQEWQPLKLVNGPTPRAMLLIELQIEGVEICVVNVHFNTPNFVFTRSEQADEVISSTQNYDRVVVMGDFNTYPSFMDPAYSKMAGSFNDIWLNSDRISFLGNSWNTYFPIFRVDYIFFKGFEGISQPAELLDFDHYSDHDALNGHLVY
ncbi:MAG: endonuclease/exonuclease/phosphatase family protein [Candidatus Heimdallarchaeota archaeon]|nr:endonuclease/exonuclease/phosphatase family protein [Candidatus Heimdallarchaeota archaeon]